MRDATTPHHADTLQQKMLRLCARALLLARDHMVDSCEYEEDPTWEQAYRTLSDKSKDAVRGARWEIMAIWNQLAALQSIMLGTETKITLKPDRVEQVLTILSSERSVFHVTADHEMVFQVGDEEYPDNYVGAAELHRLISDQRDEIDRLNLLYLPYMLGADERLVGPPPELTAPPRDAPFRPEPTNHAGYKRRLRDGL